MEFLIVTGLSGAGKTQAAHFLEDLGYYCVDNMPSALLQPFAEFCIASQGRFTKVALVTDVRAHESFEQLFRALDSLRALDCTFRILFLEAPECSSLVTSYSLRLISSKLPVQAAPPTSRSPRENIFKKDFTCFIRSDLTG